MNNRIKQIRKEKKLTQAAMAGELSLSQNHIAQIESGTRAPSARTISDICRVYHVNEEWLRKGNGETYRSCAEEEELYAWMKSALSRGDPFQKRFLRMLSRLRPEHWGALEEMMQLMSGE